jgi:SAM-dependent methyltransferase
MEAKVKLNMGCRDRIMIGYINVDEQEEWRGKKADLVTHPGDLSKFADNSVDEIVSIHYIQYFYYWEAEKILKEWLRVLKPQGELIIESPNLLTACQMVMKEPFRAAGPGPESQMSMWCFYGNPAEENPQMCNRWLYTPQTLIQLLGGIGYVNLKQDGAQFKLKEPRDFRVVGQKTWGDQE